MKSRLAWMLLAWVIPAAAADFDYPMQAQRLAPDIFAIVTPTRELPNAENGGWNSNSAFVVTPSGVLLFDSGSSTAIGDAIRETIASVTPQPVRWIVNSHGHGDHWLGSGAFGDSVEQIIASREVAQEIETGGRRWIESFDRMTGGITGNSTILAPNRIIEQEEKLSFGGREAQLILSGGSHSPGDLMLWLADDKILLSGDVVYSDRMPSTNAADLRQWIETLQRLRELEPKIVVPGHGNVTDLAGMERLQALLTALWQAVEEGVEAGLGDYEMLDDVSVALSAFEPHYPGLEEKLRRDISHVYLQVEAAAFE